MAKNTYKKNKPSAKEKTGKKRFRLSFAFLKDRRFQLTIGLFLIIGSIYLMTAFISYLFTGKADQTVVEAIGQTGVLDSGRETENWLGLSGAFVSHYFIFRWFGLAAYFTPVLMFLIGYKIVFRKELLPIYASFVFCAFFTLWVCVLLGYTVYTTEGVSRWGFVSGGIGYELALMLEGLIGWGTILLLIFSLLVFIIYYFNITSMLTVKGKISSGVESLEKNISSTVDDLKVKEDLDQSPADSEVKGYTEDKDN